MKRIPLWTARIFILVFGALFLVWSYAEIAQWRFRRQAEHLLAYMKTVQLGSSAAETIARLNKWKNSAEVIQRCTENPQSICYYDIIIRHYFPTYLQESADDRSWNIPLRVIDIFGIRQSAVSLNLKYEDGVIRERGYSVLVGLPVKDWYAQDHAYIPDLLVSAFEETQFRSSIFRERATPGHPFRMARHMKGNYGLEAAFTSQESPAEQARLLDFHFSCITRFFPCQSTKEILPEAYALLEADNARQP